MKKLLSILLLAGCAHKPLAPVPAPSVGAVKSGILRAQTQITAAGAFAEEIGGHISAARSKAERIDGKTTVILENWQ